MKRLDILRRSLLNIFAMWMCTYSVSLAQVYQTKSGYVEFVSSTTLESFTGTSRKLQGLIELSSGKVDFYVDLNTISTGISLRDEHMRETYLETRKYPFAEFTGTLRNFNIARKDTQQVQVVGKYTIHGVTRDRTINGRMYVSGNTAYVEAAWDVNLKDHNIEIPKLMFLKLAEVQKVRIKATLKKN